MKVLIVTTRFFPFGSATSTVVGNLAEALLENKCEVTVLALSRIKDYCNENQWHGIRVIQSYAPSMIQKEEIKTEWKKHLFRTSRGLFLRVSDIVIRKLRPDFRKNSIDYSKARRYRAAIEKEIKKNYDLCMVTLMPIEAVWAANSIDFGNTAYAIYQLDPYWNNADLSKDGENDRWTFETQFVNKTSFCLTTPVISKINTDRMPELGRKYIEVEFPCLKKNNGQTDVDIDKESEHCVFLGALNPEIRPPEKVVSILACLERPNTRFDFYGSGQSLVEQASDYAKAKKNIKLHGVISSAEAEKIRANADFLLNIDNTSTALVPSKIFEYFSTGKPILNFYFSEDSHTLTYMKRYPLCLNINVYDDLTENAQRINAFLDNYRNKTIEFDTVQALFAQNTPDYVARICLEAYAMR